MRSINIFLLAVFTLTMAATGWAQQSGAKTAALTENGEMPLWINDTLNSEISLLEKKKAVLTLRNEIKQLEVEAEALDNPPEPETPVNNGLGFPANNAMGMPGSSMGFPAGQSVQQPVLNQNMGYPYISMPQEHPITIPPQPTDTRPIDGGPGVDSPQLEKSEPISPKKEVDLPRIARIFGKKEHLMAVLTYESGGSCTVFVGDVLPKGGEILSINARGVTVEIDEDQKRSLMFSQQFEGGSTLGAQQTLPGMDMPAPPPLMDEMTPDSTTATPLY